MDIIGDGPAISHGNAHHLRIIFTLWEGHPFKIRKGTVRKPVVFGTLLRNSLFLQVFRPLSSWFERGDSPGADGACSADQCHLTQSCFKKGSFARILMDPSRIEPLAVRSRILGNAVLPVHRLVGADVGRSFWWEEQHFLKFIGVANSIVIASSAPPY